MAVVKFSKQTIQPNPIEVDYWVDIKTDPYGSVWKYYNGTDWVALNLGDGSGGGLPAFNYYTKTQINEMLNKKADIEFVESKVDDAEFAKVIQNIEFREIGDDSMELVMLKYDGIVVGVTVPIATETNAGMVAGKDFKNFVKQYQLQQLYTEMYDIVKEIREQYQPRLKAGQNIVIDQTTNTISATGELSVDWDTIPNVPEHLVQSISTEDEVINVDETFTTQVLRKNELTLTEEEKALVRSNLSEDRINEGGMNYVVLRKDLSFAEQLTHTNTIYEIRYDFDLNGEEVTIPEGCTLKFEGGSLANGTLSGAFFIESTPVKIFSDVKFSGGCTFNQFNLDWFVENKNTSVVFTGAKDSSDEIQAAFDSGVLNIYTDNNYYYYISKQLNLKSYVKFSGRKQTVVNTRDSKKANACLYTDKDIIVLNIVADSNNSTKISSMYIEGISIRRYGSFSYNNYKEDIPTIKIVSGDNPYNFCWGVYIDVDLFSADIYLSGLPDPEDDTATISSYMCGYTGIDIEAKVFAHDDVTYKGYFTHIQLKGTVYGFRRALNVTADRSNGAWISDLRLDFDSDGVYGGNITGSPIRITGSHQLKPYLYKTESPYYFDVDGYGVLTGMIWDTGLVDSSTKLSRAWKSYRANYNFRDLTSSTDAIDINSGSVLPPSSPSVYKPSEYLHNYLGAYGNILEQVFCNIEGWRCTDNAAVIGSATTKGLLGTFNYARLYNADRSDYVELSENNTRNFNKLFKLSSYSTDGTGVFADMPHETALYTGSTTEYYNYEVSYTFPSSVYYSIISRSYLYGISDNNNALTSLLINGIEYLTFEDSYQYYSRLICVPMPKKTELKTGDTEIIIRGKVVKSSSNVVIPKIGIVSTELKSNLITSSGGEIPKRLALGDVALYSPNVEKGYIEYSTRYLKNNYIGKGINLYENRYTKLLCIEVLYNYVTMVTYCTTNGTIGSVLIKTTGIVSSDGDIDFQLIVDNTTSPSKLLLSARSAEGTKLMITEVNSLSRVKFNDLSTELTASETFESIRSYRGGESSKRPLAPVVGTMFFDTSLTPPKPIYWSGTTWVDANGVNVDETTTETEVTETTE